MKNRNLSLATTVVFIALMAGFQQWEPLSSAAANIGQQSKVDFVRDIQPIFQSSCYGCHGPSKQMAGLRLDSKKIALAKVIVAGNASESALYQRVAGIGDQARMPMKGEALKPDQVALIRRWIDEGANWPEDNQSAIRNHPQERAAIKQHWAFVKPARPALPEVNDKTWVKTPIDRFILARLEKEGLRPSPEAGRVALLRRLSLDLIGLPPTVAEVDAFLNDRSPNAYEKQVERLLNGPHYGERWGRHWLDAARYADSDGFEKDKQRWVWFYRDWVINALNADKPYDRFIIEQIAGDLLPNATQDQIVATGFLRNSMINEEGGVDPEQFRMEAMFDRMEAIGKGVLGLTIQCAQCHNHKFDPLKQEEYYRMFAFLNNSHEGSVAVYTPEEQMKRANIFSRIREIEAALQERTPDWRKRMAEWEAKGAKDQPEWIVVKPDVEDISTGGQRYLPMKESSYLAQGYAPTKHRVKMSVKVEQRDITAFRLELLTDPNLPMGGPGRSSKGAGALTEFEVEAAPATDPKKIVKIKLIRATADYNQPERELGPIYDDKSKRRRVTGPIEFAIDGKDETAWGIDAGPGLRNQPRKAVFVAEKPIANDGGTILTFYLKQNHGGWNSDDNQNNNLGRMRLSITTATDAAADPLPAGVREILSIPGEKRTQAQFQTVFSYWRTTVPEFGEANKQIVELWGQHPEGSSQLVLRERDDARATHLLKRGDFLKPDRAVTTGVPAFLHPLPADAEPNRLAFAKWLVDSNSPTTARAMVNRVWQSYFGAGLVATPEDFGAQSEAPSHPELLDWLAVEFMNPTWRAEEWATGRQGDRATGRQGDRATGRWGDTETRRQNKSAIRNPQSAIGGLEPETYSSVDREFIRVSPIVEDHAAIARTRSAQSPDCARTPLARRSRGRARRGPLGERVAQSESRRPERLSARARISLPSACELRPEAVGRKQERRPLSPRALHVPLPFGAISGAAGLRRSERRLLLRPPRKVEHAVAGPDDAQRDDLPRSRARVGVEDGERRRRDRRLAIGIRFPQGFGEEVDRAGIGGIDRIVEQAARTFCGRRIESVEPGDQRSRQTVSIAERHEDG